MSQPVELNDGGMARALIAPELGGWLLKYGRTLPKHGWVEAIRFDQAVLDRYPLQMYAGNPLLFPLVSYNVVGGKEHLYQWAGKVYPLPQHGFARRSSWSVIDRQSASMTMELKDSATTREVYPFAFSHRVTYRLEQGRLVFAQQITNHSGEIMPFGTGIHPYLQVPLTTGSRREDCVVRLPKCQKAVARPQMAGFDLETQAALVLPVSEDVAGTLLLTDLSEKKISLIDQKGGVEVSLDWTKAPGYKHVALWSKSTSEPFYCIEPWTSLPNAFGRETDHDLVLLQPGQVFSAEIDFDIRSV